MPWEKRNPDLTNNPLYLEPRVNEIDVQLADIVINIENYPIQTPEVDDSGRLQRAIDSLNGKPGTIFLPKPLYTVNSQVNLNQDYINIRGNGFNTVIVSNQDNKIFYVTGHYVTIENMKLKVTSTTRTNYTVESYNTNKTMIKNVYFDNTGNSLSGMWFRGGSMGLAENCMFNHSRLRISTWDVKVDKCYLWALSQDYGIGITDGAGNVTITNTDIVPPFKSNVNRKAALYIDSSNGACSNIKFIGGYFDGNPTLETGVGCLITPSSFNVLISDFSANKMDEDVIVIDSAFNVTVENGLFNNNNNKGFGGREIFIKKSTSQNPEGIIISNNQMLQTTAITGSVAAAIEVDTTVVSQTGIKIENNYIKQPGSGGAYTNPEIKGVNINDVKLATNRGTLSRYRSRGSQAVASGATWITISALSTVPMAYEPLLSSYKINSDFILPTYRLQKNSINSVHIAPSTATPAAGNIHWEVEL